MANPPKKRGDPENVNIRGGNESINIGGDNRGTIIYKSNVPPAPTADQLFQAGLNALRGKLYREAIGSLTQSLILESRPQTLYTLALAQLQGRRPRLLDMAQAERIDRWLSEACANPEAPAHYFYLRAIVYYDFFIANGFRDDEETIDTLFAQSDQRPFQRAAALEMIAQVNAPDSPIVRWLVENI